LNDNEFGIYLKSIRESKGLTQEQLGDAVGKKKMTISLIENGKNAPPQDVFLDQLIEILNPSRNEEIKLRDLAALARKCIPSDIAEYFIQNKNIRTTIRTAMEKGKSDDFWRKIQQSIIDD
jgi:transcriptional regulator with XRE-family HTH domain